MKAKLFASLIISLITVSSVFAQSTDRAWWNSLSPAWKKVILKQQFKGKDINPTDEQLIEIGKMVFLDITGNKDIKTLKPASAFQVLEIIKAKGSGIESLEGIENLNNLREIDCSDNDNINSLAPLSKLNNLRKVNCGNTMVKSLSPLRNLQYLTYLDAHYTTIVDMRILKDLKRLEHLNVHNNISLYSLDGLEYLYELRELDCSQTSIDLLTPLSELKKLERLNCADTRVYSLRPIQLVKSLEDIDCSNTEITGTSLEYLISNRNLIMLRAKNIDITKKQITEFEKLMLKNNPNATIIITSK